MKRVILFIFLVILMFVPICLGQLWSGRTSRAGNSALVVAASNAPDHVKNTAWKVCDGTNDEAEIEAALTAYGYVVLSGGTFNISTAIDLHGGYFIAGSGVNATYLSLAANVNMFEYNSIINGDAPATTFTTIRDMTLVGNSSTRTGGGIIMLHNHKDLHLKNLFVTDFNGVGIHTRGSWGATFENVIIEFCTGVGLKIDNPPETVVTGTATGGFTVLDTVTQQNTAATGTVTTTISGGAGTLTVDVTSGTFNNSDTIDNDGSASTFAPSAVNDQMTTGPKLTNCKIQQNSGDHQVEIENTVYASCFTNCEFQAGVASKYAIYFDGSDKNIINACRFLSSNATASGFIGLYNSAHNNIISSCYFNLTNDVTVGVDVGSGSMGNLTIGCMFYDATATPIPWDDSASNRGRNEFINNVVRDTTGLSKTHDHVRFHWTAGALGGFTGKRIYDNALSGWADDEELVLPAAEIGMEFEFYNVSATKAMRVGPNGSEVMEKSVGGGLEAAGKYIEADSEGEYIHLLCTKAGEWRCVAAVGSWTVEG